MISYFLDHLQRTDTYSEQMLDANLAADEGKLDYLAQESLWLHDSIFTVFTDGFESGDTRAW